ncbi:DNA polymerase [Pelistega indica]|uniref:DNA repair protein RecO n=1 Tax=Pelistega indica TaxID=1414851 RepID=V8GAC6_9BURK|nr:MULTISPECIES: DNA repair protein RecO [Pelistega]ETD72903.1 DNA polymerase [Pelistega indica]
MSKRQHKVIDAHAFLLKAIPWSETSCVATVFSRDYGLVAGIAKGAKRPYSVMRPILSHFQPLVVSWSGTGEVKTITQAEFDGFIALPSKALMSAWYLNELLLRSLPPEDSFSILYDEYVFALQNLSSGLDERIVLRRFEWLLLKEVGYGMDESMPDFYQLESEPLLRQRLRQAIDNYLEGKTLNTRKVVTELKNSYPR